MKKLFLIFYLFFWGGGGGVGVSCQANYKSNSTYTLYLIAAEIEISPAMLKAIKYSI